MNVSRIIRTACGFAAAAALAFTVSSCATDSNVIRYDEDGNPINPHPPGSHAHFTFDSSYPKTHDVWKDEELLAKTDDSNSHIVIDLEKQRGFLMNGDRVVIDYPVTTGKSSHPTPTGEFTVTERIVDKSSNKYGTIYDADGERVKYPADITRDEVPEGGEFVGSPMQYWMRLTNSGIGLHVGPMRRTPASHGCIRGPRSTHPIVFRKSRVGTPVLIR